MEATTFSVSVANTNGAPNGIVYDPDQMGGMLWTAFSGSNAPVKGYMLDGSAGPVIPTTLSNIDGITRDCFGDLFLASWTPDADDKIGARAEHLDQYGLERGQSRGHQFRCCEFAHLHTQHKLQYGNIGRPLPYVPRPWKSEQVLQRSRSTESFNGQFIP